MKRTTLLLALVLSPVAFAADPPTKPPLTPADNLVVDGVPARFWSEREALAELAPRGLDIIFTCGPHLAALPRTTRVSR